MSWEATTWALKSAPTGSDCAAKVILIALGNYARPDGTGAYPSVATLEKLSGKSERTVRRKLLWMESQGIIRRGDQSAVSHIRADRRPVVWDLAMDVSRIPVDDRLDESGSFVADPTGCQNDTPSDETRQNVDLKPISRGDKMTPRFHGVSKQTPRGVMGDRHGVSPVTPERKDRKGLNKLPPKAPQGVAAADEKSDDDPDFDSLRSLWPKKTGKPSQLRKLWDTATSKVGSRRVFDAAKEYLKSNRGVEARYLKGLRSWLSDPVCWSAESPSVADEQASPMQVALQWLDDHGLDSRVRLSVYEMACLVRSHPEVSASGMRSFLDSRFLREAVR